MEVKCSYEPYLFRVSQGPGEYEAAVSCFSFLWRPDWVTQGWQNVP